jgi:hypothetical protein
MTMKEGSKEKLHGEGGIGLIASRLTLEGPLRKNKASFLLSGRRTYADALVRPFIANGDRGYYFYDLNAKVNYDFGRKDKLYLSGYFGRDRFFSRDRGDNNSLFGPASTGATPPVRCAGTTCSPKSSSPIPP